MSPVVEVLRTYLELRSLDQLHGTPARDDIRFVQRVGISVTEYRRLYLLVGDQWYWHDRNRWSDDKLAAYLADPSVSVWEALVGDDSAGYFEIQRDSDDSAEIAYFGLASEFIGRGLGKVMLARAVEEAFALGVPRVWLHTCTLDSPHALPNYLARGFEPFRQETFVVQLPE